MIRFLILFLFYNICNSQTLSLDECISFALKNNNSVKAAYYELQGANVLRKTSFEIPKTSISYTQGQFNSVYKSDNNFSASQSFPFPTVFSQHKKYLTSSYVETENKKQVLESDLIYQIKTTYYSNLFYVLKEKFLLQEDSIYKAILNEPNHKKNDEQLENINSRIEDLNSELLENYENKINTQIQLQILMNYDKDVAILTTQTIEILIPVGFDSTNENAFLNYLNSQITTNEKLINFERAKHLPDITFGYFNLSVYGQADIGFGPYFLSTRNRLQGFSVGLNVPIWFYPLKIKTEANKIHSSTLKANYNNQISLFNNELKLNKMLLNVYKKNLAAKPPSKEVMEVLISKQYSLLKNKSIAIDEYLEKISSTIKNENNYLAMVLKNNLAVLKINYLQGK